MLPSARGHSARRTVADRLPRRPLGAAGDHPRLVDELPGFDGGERRPADAPTGLPGRTLVRRLGRRRVRVDAHRVHPARRLVRRHLRAPPRAPARPGRLRDGFAALWDRADAAAPRPRAGGAGDRRRAPGSEQPGDPDGVVRPVGARTGGRSLGVARRDRRGDRSAGRGPDRRYHLVARHLLPEPADRGVRLRRRPAAGPGVARRRGGATHRPAGCGDRRGVPGGADVRVDRGIIARMDVARGPDRLRRRRGGVRGVHRDRASVTASDGAPVDLRQPHVLVGEPRDPRDLRRARRSEPVPGAGRPAGAWLLGGRGRRQPRCP